jgi:hypothetical protein
MMGTGDGDCPVWDDAMLGVHRQDGTGGDNEICGLLREQSGAE